MWLNCGGNATSDYSCPGPYVGSVPSENFFPGHYQAFTGSIDSVLAFTRGLDESEIQMLVSGNGGYSEVDDRNSTLAYGFDDEDGELVSDCSGN